MTKRWALPLFLIAFGLFYLLPLASHGLWIPDESRYAQVSQGMLLSGNWISPHLIGLRYFEKPDAGYWMIAIGQWLFGDNLFGVRVASAISLGLSVLLTWFVARRLWNDPRRSLAASVIYMSMGLVASQSGYANLDPQFTLWVNLSLAAVWFAVDSTTHRAKLIWWSVLGLACGMGFMTKGFLAWLLPVLIAGPYMLWQRRLGELIRYGLLTLLVTALISIPWALAIHLQEPDFWNFFFWNEHIRRFASEDAQHDHPWWFYLPLLALSSLPWVTLIPGTLRQAWQARDQKKIVFLLLWAILPFIFFSLARGKLPAYIMPCLLPLALLMGHGVINRLEQSRTGGLRVNGLFNLALGVIALIALPILQHKHHFYVHETLHMTLMVIVVLAWIITNLLQALRPARLWMAPALGMLLVSALVPGNLPNSIAFAKAPDAFITEHAAELAQTHSLMANDLGVATTLSWHVQRPEIFLYDIENEAKYGLTYPEAAYRAVTLAQIQPWMTEARKAGSVGVVMRVKGDDELHEIDLLPKDGKRYELDNLVILIFAQTPP